MYVNYANRRRENIKMKVVAVVEQCDYRYSVLFFFLIVLDTIFKTKTLF